MPLQLPPLPVTNKVMPKEVEMKSRNGKQTDALFQRLPAPILTFHPNFPSIFTFAISQPTHLHKI